MSLSFASQSRINFDPDLYREMGITDILVSPFQVNAESYQNVSAFGKRLSFLKQKSDEIKRNRPEARVVINMFTILHPEGNFKVPERFRAQLDLNGEVRSGFVCFLDEQRQSELLEMYRLIAEAGFEYVMIDDDFRDAFCFCDEHLKQFQPFSGLTRADISLILNNSNHSPEELQIRREWLDFRRQGLWAFARKIESTLHDINPRLRIGICISAKRCNDLSGRAVQEWLSIFNTPEAPVFVRLAGEHYTDVSLGMCQSVGWHQYFRDLVPPNTEMMAEVTYVYPICFKSPAAIRLETKIHLAGGLEKVLLAWVEDYKYNAGWRMLANEQKNFSTIYEKSRGVADSVGIAFYVPENCAEFTPVDEIANVDPINAYQGFATMGFPVRMADRLDASSKVAVLTGYLPKRLKQEAVEYLDGGGTLVIDAMAAQSFSRIMPSDLVKYQMSGRISGLRLERALHNGEAIDELAGFSPTSTYRLNPKDGAETLSELFSVDGERRGAGCLLYPASNGWIVVLSYDLCQVHYRLASDNYRRFLTHILERVGYRLEVQLLGDLFVQPLLFTHPDKRVVMVNYSSYEANVECVGSWTRNAHLVDILTGEKIGSESISIPPLDARILVSCPVPCADSII